MLGLALGAAKMIGGAAKAKAGKGARVAKNMMGRGRKDDGGGGGARHAWATFATQSSL